MEQKNILTKSEEPRKRRRFKRDPKSKKTLTPQELQKRKKLIIFPAMGLAFIASLWLIFAPSGKDKTEEDGLSGFNAELPLPDDDEIFSDKRKAYEEDHLRRAREERMLTLDDFSFEIEVDNKAAYEESGSVSVDAPAYRSYDNSSPIYTSNNKYWEINQQLGSFYEEPVYYDEEENDELSERINELEKRLLESESSLSSTDEQLALLEKSYELAAKYTNQGQQGEETGTQPAQEVSGDQKTKAVPVNVVSESVVSGLQQPMSDSAFIETYTKPRNTGFHTASGSRQTVRKNTIQACIHENQAVMDGQNVRLRLLEPFRAGQLIIPRNTLISGRARIQRERLDIEIVSVEYNGTIISVDLAVYDSDGQRGLASPTTLEMQSLTEGAANIGSGIGSSFTVNQNAGSAIVSDLTRGALQGGSQYLSKKLRTAQINLKADYRVMLLAN